jgi:micrococcal nuclease
MKRYFLLISLLCLFLAIYFTRVFHYVPSVVQPPLNSLIVSSIDSVYDGDTFFANIAGLPEVFGQRIGIRLAGIDTPEIRGKCPSEKLLAVEAKVHLQNLLSTNEPVELRNITRGKYFRLVADVYVGSLNVSESLINHRLAVRYTGKVKKRGWCD